MDDSCLSMDVDRVRAAIARHLHVATDTILPEQDLRLDLGLEPLDLVLIAIRLEEEEPTNAFPVADLEWTDTVSELARLATTWSLRGGRHRPKESGFLVAAHAQRAAG